MVAVGITLAILYILILILIFTDKKTRLGSKVFWLIVFGTSLWHVITTLIK